MLQKTLVLSLVGILGLLPLSLSESSGGDPDHGPMTDPNGLTADHGPMTAKHE